jgi:carboxyl-terminal processing protease
LPGGKPPTKIVEIVRETVTLDTQAVQSDIFEAGTKADGTPYKIGFIDVPDFYLDSAAVRRNDPNPRSVTSDTRKKLKEFVENKVDAVVLDLRSNGGGVLHEAIEMTGLFLGPGVVVQTKDEASSYPVRRENNPATPCEWTGPLVVITNKLSASASEIFSGAIKDYGRGLIVGDSATLGKGTIQQVIDLTPPFMMGQEYGDAKVTVGGFYRPSGITTQGTGVPVDIVLPSRSDVMEGYTEADLDNMLTLRRVDAANFTPKQYVTPQIIADLKKRSDARIRECEEFAKLFEKIVLLKESQTKRVTPLNEAKYMAEEKRSTSEESEDEELEEMLNKDKRIKRDFYVDEVLAITVDYLTIAGEMGISFPKERTIQPRRSFLGQFGL